MGKWAGQMQEKFPGGGELWFNHERNMWFLAYRVPQNGRWMLYWIDSDQQLKDIVGDVPIHGGLADRQFNNAEAAQWGLLESGHARQLLNTSAHPFTALTADWEKTVRARPWLADPEVLAIHVDAILEGRGEPTIDEWASTNWWRTHSEKERQWITLWHQDISTALKRLDDTRAITRNALIEAGVRDPDVTLVDLMASNLANGRWTEEYWKTQIKYVADPFSLPDPNAQDFQVRKLLDALRQIGQGPDTTQKGVDKVTEAVQRYLGPAFAGGWKDENIQYWAGQIRNDPDAEQRLKSMLQQQFQALFPVYKDNPNADYETVAAPWRSYVSQLWGQDPDETDPLFLKVVAMNDAQAAAETLRKEGLTRGIGKVVNEAAEALGSQFGFGVMPTGR